MSTLRNTSLDELGHSKVHFRHHLVLYLVLSVIFWSIWYTTGSGYMWPVWPMALGLIGMLFHYIQAWGE